MRAHRRPSVRGSARRSSQKVLIFFGFFARQTHKSSTWARSSKGPTNAWDILQRRSSAHISIESLVCGSDCSRLSVCNGCESGDIKKLPSAWLGRFRENACVANQLTKSNMPRSAPTFVHGISLRTQDGSSAWGDPNPTPQSVVDWNQK